MLALVVLVAVGGCGEGEGEEALESGELSLLQVSRSGSFLAAGDGRDLVLRGVGGGALLTGTGASENAIAVAKLFARLDRLAGPGPYEATLQGAEVNPIAYSLRLSRPRFDGRTGTVRWRAEIRDGLPRSAPASFGAAALRVDLGVEAATLRGEVVAAGEGGPVPGAQVTVAAEGLGLASGLADQQGRFEIGALPAGTGYTVEASKPGFERSRATAEPGGEEELRIAIEPVAERG